MSTPGADTIRAELGALASDGFVVLPEVLAPNEIATRSLSRR